MHSSHILYTTKVWVGTSDAAGQRIQTRDSRCPRCAQDAGEYEAAEAYYTRLLDFGAGSREAAKSSLREIRTLQVGRGGAGGLLKARPPGCGTRWRPPAG